SAPASAPGAYPNNPPSRPDCSPAVARRLDRGESPKKRRGEQSSGPVLPFSTLQFCSRSWTATSALDRVLVALTGADADRLFDRRDEDLAVADLAGLGCRADGGDDIRRHRVGHHDLEPHPTHELQ